MKPLSSLLHAQHVTRGPYAVLLIVVIVTAMTIQHTAMNLPGIATPAAFSGTPPSFFLAFIAYLLLAAMWLGSGSTRDLRQDISRVSRDVGLTTPTLPAATGRRRLSLPLGVALLVAAIALAAGGQEVLVHLFWQDLALISRDQDWRYLAAYEAPETAVIAMTFFNAPVPEELIFRGIPLALLLALYRHPPQVLALRPFIAAVLLVGALAAFAAWHLGSGPLNVLTAAWSGTIYLAAALLTRSLWIPITAHFLHNLYVYSQWLDWWPS